MTVKDQVSVAVINFHPVWGDKEANLKKMVTFIRNAADKKANMILFPEVALTGYEVEPEAAMHKKSAETIPGPATEEIGKQAAKYGVYTIFGMPERDNKDSKIYNSVSVIGPQGNVIGKYRKAHPWLPEFAWCVKGPGDYEPIQTEFGPIGVSICYDNYIFPEVARILALKGARLIFSATATPYYEGWELVPYMINQLKARSIENLVFIASANLVGKELTLRYLGNSLVTGSNFPATTFMYAGPASEYDEELLVSQLDFNKLDEMRKAIPHFADRRPDTYGFLTKKL